MRRGCGVTHTGVLARRLRGLGMAWHSHRLEEFQAFTERDLDMNGDGFVTVQDIFTYLRSKRQTATTSRRTAEESGLSRPHTLDDLHRQRLLGR
ncbi:unnamed protein product, partial [Sphacelaria rigidula]